MSAIRKNNGIIDGTIDSLIKALDAKTQLYVWTTDADGNEYDVKHGSVYEFWADADFMNKSDRFAIKAITVNALGLSVLIYDRFAEFTSRGI